jgi:uncharacterized membrane protein
MVIGTSLISNGAKHAKAQRNWFLYAVMAAIFFAFSFILAKIVYLNTNFVSGLIWTRLGMAVGALTILFVPAARRKILSTTRDIRPSGQILFLVGQSLAAGAGVLQNYAVSLGSVPLLNALQGTQFVFLFLLTGTLSRWFPKVLKEDFGPSAIARKLIAVILIGLGLFLVAS